jgi:hypothetical protein
MRPNALLQIARADFLERSRRYGFLVTLVGTIFLAYQVHIGNVEARVFSARGVFNSAWLGGVMTLTVTVFLSLVGFYLVKNAVERDRLTRVGEILATTPMSRVLYCLGKTLSNFLVLSTLIAILAVSAVVIQLITGESGHIDLVALLSPFILFALPAMLFVSALAVLFECTPVLRGGVGNVFYLFLWALPLILAMEVQSSPDIYGARAISQSMKADALAWLPHMAPRSAAASRELIAADNGFSFTIGGGLGPPAKSTFVWNGVRWTPALVASRLEVVGLALLIALVAALFFDRFDPSRSWGRRRHVSDPLDLPQASGAKVVALAPAHAVVARLHRAEPGFRFVALVLAELRVLLRGARRWWLAVALGLAIAQLFAPTSVSQQILLPIAWLWPVLLWSGLGSREKRNGTEGLVFASPRLLTRQWPATWVAGVLLSVATGAGLVVRLAIAGDGMGLAAWAAGALFVPSLALALGVWSGNGKFFEALYTVIWYLGPMNHLPQLDYIGGVATPERAHITIGFLIAAAALFAVSFVGRKRQLDTA